MTIIKRNMQMHLHVYISMWLMPMTEREMEGATDEDERSSWRSKNK